MKHLGRHRTTSRNAIWVAGLATVVVLAAVMIGAAALGMFGALIALPLAAAVIIVAREMVLPALAAFVDEKADAVEPRRPRPKRTAEAP